MKVVASAGMQKCARCGTVVSDVEPKDVIEFYSKKGNFMGIKCPTCDYSINIETESVENQVMKEQLYQQFGEKKEERLSAKDVWKEISILKRDIAEIKNILLNNKTEQSQSKVKI